MKKAISLILCVVLTFSIFAFAVCAEVEANPTESYEYVISTETTEKSTEFESLVDELIGDNLKDKSEVTWIRIDILHEIFNILERFFQTIIDYVDDLAARANARIFNK